MKERKETDINTLKMRVKNSRLHITTDLDEHYQSYLQQRISTMDKLVETFVSQIRRYSWSKELITALESLNVALGQDLLWSPKYQSVVEVEQSVAMKMTVETSIFLKNILKSNCDFSAEIADYKRACKKILPASGPINIKVYALIGAVAGCLLGVFIGFLIGGIPGVAFGLTLGLIAGCFGSTCFAAARQNQEKNQLPWHCNNFFKKLDTVEQDFGLKKADSFFSKLTNNF